MLLFMAAHAYNSPLKLRKKLLKQLYRIACTSIDHHCTPIYFACPFS